MVPVLEGSFFYFERLKNFILTFNKCIHHFILIYKVEIYVVLYLYFGKMAAILVNSYGTYLRGVCTIYVVCLKKIDGMFLPNCVTS